MKKKRTHLAFVSMDMHRHTHTVFFGCVTILICTSFHFRCSHRSLQWNCFPFHTCNSSIQIWTTQTLSRQNWFEQTRKYLPTKNVCVCFFRSKSNTCTKTTFVLRCHLNSTYSKLDIIISSLHELVCFFSFEGKLIRARLKHKTSLMRFVSSEFGLEIRNHRFRLLHLRATDIVQCQIWERQKIQIPNIQSRFVPQVLFSCSISIFDKISAVPISQSQ